MDKLKNIHLVLFFTKGVSLKIWDETGLFEREVALYKALKPHLGNITFVTYGGADELRYTKRLDGIRILCNRCNLPQSWYARLIGWLFPILCRGNIILKTKQVPGADLALTVARRFGKKFIARCGYLHSNKEVWKFGPDSRQAKEALNLEDVVFNAADKAVVTTEEMRKTLIERYHIDERKLRVIPNYVDTKIFAPLPSLRQPSKLCFIGRLQRDKNVSALLDAIAGLDVELDIIGGGKLLEELKAKAKANNLRVNFFGNMPNHELPNYLNRAGIFIQPSFIEDHPKVVIEAMSCGLAVIGANVQGTRDAIRHRETGYLCGTSSEELRAAIQEVMGDKELRERMGIKAREYVINNCSLERVLGMELDLLSEMCR